MKAMVYTEYGSPDVLQLKEVEKPTPQANEVLVKVHATSVNYNTMAFVSGKPFVVRLMGGGLRKPKIQKHDTRRRHRGAGGSGWQRRHTVSPRR